MRGRPIGYPGPKWPDILEGEILKSPSGKLRIARVVHYGNQRIYVYFSIAHPSWTTRCYTLYTTNELVSLGYRRTGKYVHYFEGFDLDIADEMNSGVSPPKIHAREVRGLS